MILLLLPCLATIRGKHILTEALGGRGLGRAVVTDRGADRIADKDAAKLAVSLGRIKLKQFFEGQVPVQKHRSTPRALDNVRWYESKTKRRLELE